MTAEFYKEKEHAFITIGKDIKEGNIPRLVLLCGKEDYLIRFYADMLIKKYLGRVENSVQAGWLLHFLEYYYIGILKDSEYLSSVAQDKDLRRKIYDFIIAEALNADGNTMQFWEHKLNYCGFY